MSHVRKQIRDHLLSTITGLSTTGSKAYASRVYPLDSGKLPAVIVYTLSEDIVESAFSKRREQDRQLDAIVEGYVRALNTFDDTLDQIASEVEAAILADTTLGGLVKNVELTGTDTDYAGDSEQPVGTVRLTFRIQYRTVTGSPNSAI